MVDKTKGLQPCFFIQGNQSKMFVHIAYLNVCLGNNTWICGESILWADFTDGSKTIVWIMYFIQTQYKC